MDTSKVGGKRPKTGGRTKGTPNKATKAAKDAIALAAEGLGGTDRLIAWVQEDKKNEATFWGSIYPRLVGLTVGGDPENPIAHSMRVLFG